jgi:cytochrome c553
MVLLKGFNGAKVPEQYRRNLTEKEKSIEKGRRLVTKFNCRGCHNVEGEGGVIQKYVKGTHFFPPPLEMGDYHVGERIKGSWLFSFLKNPTPVRTWMKVKMPTFFLSDQEVRDLTAYFEALSPSEMTYESGVNVLKQKDTIAKGVSMVNYMDCGKCHDDGVKGIEFSIAGQRLRQDWIPKWLKNTRDMIPWTQMPTHWGKNEDGTYKIIPKFKLLNEVEEGNIDKQVEDIRDFITSYNSIKIDELKVPQLGSSASSEDEGAPAVAPGSSATSQAPASAPAKSKVAAKSKKGGDDDDEDDD